MGREKSGTQDRKGADLDSLVPSPIPASAHVMLIAVNLAGEAGVAADQILDKTGIRYDQLVKPALKVSRAQEILVFDNLVRTVDQPELGLKIARQLHVSSFGLPGYAMLVSDTVSDALTCLSSFPLLMGVYFDVSITSDADQLTVSISRYSYLARLEQLSVDMCLGSIMTIVADLVGMAVPALSVTVALPIPTAAHVKAHERFFGCGVRYASASSSISFPAAAMRAQCPLANPVSFHSAYAQCVEMEREWTAKANRDLLLNVTGLLVRDPAHFGSIARVAEKLCMTERTLRRRLHAHGVGFQELVDRIRFDRARQMIGSGAKIKDVADELGFSEAASFRNAFRR